MNNFKLVREWGPGLPQNQHNSRDCYAIYYDEEMVGKIVQGLSTGGYFVHLLPLAGPGLRSRASTLDEATRILSVKLPTILKERARRNAKPTPDLAELLETLRERMQDGGPLR